MKPLRLVVVRRWFTDEETLGRLSINGRFFCYTLEDEIRQEKVKAETAIPYGRYSVALTFSPKFGKVMPLIQNVPGFDGIRIHPGNTEKDTAGCLLVGFGKQGQRLTESKQAYDQLFQILTQAQQQGRPITITFYTLEKRILYIGLIAAALLLVVVVLVKFIS